MYRRTMQQLWQSFSRSFVPSSVPPTSSVAFQSSTSSGASALRVGHPQAKVYVAGGTPSPMATVATKATTTKSDAEPLHLGPRIPWDSADGEVNTDNMISAFKRAGYPLTKVLNFPAGHALKDHAHNKKGNKRVGIAAGGKFCIRPRPSSPSKTAASAKEGNAETSSLSDVELSPGESVDIPPGLLHCAWVVGDEGVTFIMGDAKEDQEGTL